MPRRLFSKADSSMDRALRRGNFDAFWREVAERRTSSPTNHEDGHDDDGDGKSCENHDELLNVEHEDEAKSSAPESARSAGANSNGQPPVRTMAWLEIRPSDAADQHREGSSNGMRAGTAQRFPRRRGRRHATRRKGYSGFAGLLVSTVNQSAVLSPARDDVATGDDTAEPADIPPRPHTAPAGIKRPPVPSLRGTSHSTFETKATDSSGLGPRTGCLSRVQEERTEEETAAHGDDATNPSTLPTQPDSSRKQGLGSKVAIPASVATSLVRKLPSTTPARRGGTTHPCDTRLNLPAGNALRSLVNTPLTHATGTTFHGLGAKAAPRVGSDQTMSLAEQLSAAIDSNAGLSTLTSSTSTSRQTTL